MTAPAKHDVIPIDSKVPSLMDMIDRALSQGANIEIIEKLMGWKERWDATEARKAFDEAIAAAKAEIPPIVRDATGHNAKKYVSFAAIARVVDPIITKHGLSYRFRTEQTADRISVTCILSHRAGHPETTTLSAPADASGSKNALQAIGSTLTYLQRYSLVQMLGLAAADDDDGNASGAKRTISDEAIEEIQNLVAETKTNIDKFLQWAGAPSVSDIPAVKYSDVIAMLNAKKKKVQS